MLFKNIFKTKKSGSPLYLYSEKELDEYEKYIGDCMGEGKQVFHEIASPDIHLDVIIIEPTEAEPYYKLITEGAGAYKQCVPNEYKGYASNYAEYVIYLPATWNINSNEHKDYWPIGELKKIARLPISCDTWLGVGHTIHSEADMSPVDPSTELNSFILLPTMNKYGENARLKMKSGKQISFYTLMPLYQKELDYEMEKGYKAFIDLIPDEDLVPVIRPDRQKYC